jgi:tetratricopeptide (TPR) repeat protein
VRLANISANDPTIQSRFINMSMAFKGFKERPILGWGQENYAIVFDKYYDPRMYNAEPWFDRVHDSIFDWLVAGGLLGLVSYLAIFGTALMYLWRSKAFRLEESAILIGLLAGYFFHNLFVFDNVTSYILFGTILGYIVWRETDAHKTKPIFAAALPLQSLGFAAPGAVVLAGILVWSVNVPGIQQNKTLIRALIDGSQGKYDVALNDFVAAADIGALGTQEVREQLAQAAAQVSGSSLPGALKQQYIDTAVAEMKKQEAVSPLDARFPLFLGLIYQSQGNFPAAKEALARSRELSPTKQSIMYQQAQNAMSLNDGNGAIEFFRQAYAVNPNNNDARIYYASFLIRAGNDALAEEILAPIVSNGVAADQRISSAYAARNEYGKIAKIWKARVDARPYDTQAFFTLAAAYYASGDKASAIATLQDVAQKNPSVAQDAQTYIQQIQSATAPKAQ